MSGIKGKVGPFEISFLSPPRGREGIAKVQIDGGFAEGVRWRMDKNGITIEFSHGVFSFDISGKPSDEGEKVYDIGQRDSHLAWENLAFLRGGEEALTAAGPAKKKSLRIRAQMPGKILKVLAKRGDQVAKDQPLLVMEAMKMENEIRSPHAAEVREVKVAEGQAVESGADLMVIE